MDYNIYLAPMEGVTGYVYRNAHFEYYPGLTGYMTPFLSPYHERSLKPKELKDVLPENNKEIPLVPQILTSDAGDFVRTAIDLKSMGYEEVNLNLGCPSGTVTAKGKGAGFLRNTDELEVFLQQIFQELAADELKISIKTRLGVEEESEAERLIEIYNQFPLCNLIVHARLLKDYYKGVPRYDSYRWVLEHYTGSRVCYNGDLFDVESVEHFQERFPKQQDLMIGRGLLRNPALQQRITNPDWNKADEKERLQEFMKRLLADYKQFMYGGDTPVLYKMKEIWLYMLDGFEGGDAFEKKMKKCKNLTEYESIVRMIFQECTLK